MAQRVILPRTLLPLSITDLAIPSLVSLLPFPLTILIIGACASVVIIRIGDTYSPAYGLEQLGRAVDDLDHTLHSAGENYLLPDVIFTNMVKLNLMHFNRRQSSFRFQLSKLSLTDPEWHQRVEHVFALLTLTAEISDVIGLVKKLHIDVLAAEEAERQRQFLERITQHSARHLVLQGASNFQSILV